MEMDAAGYRHSWLCHAQDIKRFWLRSVTEHNIFAAQGPKVKDYFSTSFQNLTLPAPLLLMREFLTGPPGPEGQGV
jgi:hypothetical protein